MAHPCAQTDKGNRQQETHDRERDSHLYQSKASAIQFFMYAPVFLHSGYLCLIIYVSGNLRSDVTIRCYNQIVLK